MNHIEFESIFNQLPPRRRKVLEFFLAGKTDQEIADIQGTQRNTVSYHISKVCKDFGFSNGEGYSYRDELVLEFIEHRPNLVAPSVKDKVGSTLQLEQPRFPGGPLAAKSPFYIERLPVEHKCYAGIEQPGALIRIQAPGKMGKTSLLNRLLEHSQEKLNYRVATAKFHQLNKTDLESLDSFLRWFCASISESLMLELKLDEYWNDSLGSGASCTRYLQNHILSAVEGPVVIAMDEADRLFEYPDIAKGFFRLVRGWHEEAANLEIWQQFRQVLVYATDIYLDFDTNFSPFNVGLPIKLPPLKAEQVKTLAQCYGLEKQFDDANIHALMALVGGMPHLVQLALYHLHKKEWTLEEILEPGLTQYTVYGSHLETLENKLNDHPDLLAIFEKVLASEEPMPLNGTVAKKLEGLGLIKRLGMKMIQVSCHLYQKYFEV